MGIAVVGSTGTRLVAVFGHPEPGPPSIWVEGLLPVWRARATADRVRAALLSSGYPPGGGRVLVLLVPAITEETGVLDLPIALAVLGAWGYLPAGGLEGVHAGALTLGGRIRGGTSSRLVPHLLRNLTSQLAQPVPDR